MKHRILTAVVVIPLFITLSTTPALCHPWLHPSGYPAGANDYQSGRPNLQRHHGEDHV